LFCNLLLKMGVLIMNQTSKLLGADTEICT
jgi:hypothetical protein